MKALIITIINILFITHLTIAQCDTTQINNWTSLRPDGHGPAGVMGDHSHSKGGFMFSYKYMYMSMEGNIQGSESISDADIFNTYMVAPQSMRMQMHMVGAMYALTDRFTIMAMGNYRILDMDLRNRMDMTFSTTSSGFGDISLSAVIKVLNANRQAVLLNPGIRIPTGSVTGRDDTPAMQDMKLPYPMQIGSGTWDPYLGLTYLGQTNNLSWGLQPMLVVRTGENSEGYRFGNEFTFNAWGAVKATEFLSFSVRGAYNQSSPIKGADPELNPMMIPTANANSTGRETLSLYGGTNLYIPSGPLKNFRLGLEAGLPVYQYAQGIQMKQQWSLIAGIKYSFGAPGHCCR